MEIHFWYTVYQEKNVQSLAIFKVFIYTYYDTNDFSLKCVSRNVNRDF